MKTYSQVQDELEIILFTMSDERSNKPIYFDQITGELITFSKMIKEVQKKSDFGKRIVKLYGK